MNNDRRKRIEKVQETLAELLAEIEALRDEEQEALENLPESLQETERGERMQTAADALDDAYTNLDSVNDSLTEALEA